MNSQLNVCDQNNKLSFYLLCWAEMKALILISLQISKKKIQKSIYQSAERLCLSKAKCALVSTT